MDLNLSMNVNFQTDGSTDLTLLPIDSITFRTAQIPSGKEGSYLTCPIVAFYGSEFINER